MAQVKLIHGDALKHGMKTDLILTDPPFEMSGENLAKILDLYESNHLVLITSMKQLLELNSSSNWVLNFDFVIDGVVPKKSKNIRQPNYTHQTGVYMTRNAVKSVFNRKKKKRHDAYEENGYWPTIFNAPRNNIKEHGHAKNIDAITDILGSFDISSVCDPFAGSASTAFAAWELDIQCTVIEKDRNQFNKLKTIMEFMSIYGLEIVE